MTESDIGSRRNTLSSFVKRTKLPDPIEQVDRTLPIFKKLSRLNDRINSMSNEELQSKLRDANYESSGSIDSCRKRLKNVYRHDVLTKVLKANINYNYDVICVVDFEATCERDSPTKNTIQEIIEFPAILVDLKTKQITSKFHEYVRPEVFPHLSDFCTQLTGITQNTVDKADTFVNVLDRFEAWLYAYLKKRKHTSFAFATDGPWDMSHFFSRQVQLSQVTFPAYAKRWINLRKVFSSLYKTQPYSLNQMLIYLGMEFEGRRHSGLDDALNIANVLIRMLIDGANPVINERISWHQSDRNCWTDLKCGYVRVLYNKPSSGLNMSDSEDSLDEESDDGTKDETC